MSEPSSNRSIEILRAVLQILWQKPDGLPARKIMEALPAHTRLTQAEISPSFATGTPLYEKIAREATNPLAEVGWLIKTRERWYISDEGLLVFKNKKGVEALYAAAVDLCEHNQKARTDIQLSIEHAEELAWRQIWEYLNEMNAVEFKFMVADLFKGLNYHMDWVAPPGKQRGYIDLVAYPIPLGSSGPRVKVHVQHGGQPATMEGLRTFMGELSQHDLGVFVSSGGFTAQVLQAERSQGLRRIRLVTLQNFFEFWVQNYDRLSPEAKRRFPLKAIYFLAPPR